MRRLVSLSGVCFCLVLGSWIHNAEAAQILQAERKAMQDRFMESFQKLTETVELLENDRGLMVNRLSNIEFSISQLDSKINAKKDVDTSRFATKEEIDQLRAEIQKLNEEWSRKNSEIRTQIEESFKKLESDIRSLAFTPPPSNSGNSGSSAGPSSSSNESLSSSNKPAVVPSGHKLYELEIKAGDNYSSLVRYINSEYKVDITVDDLKKANPSVDPRRLSIGQIISFPLPDNIKP